MNDSEESLKDQISAIKESIKNEIINASKSFNCLHCDYISKNKINLQHHVLYNHKKELVNCTNCDYSTRNPYKLKCHILNKHGTPQLK